MKKFLALFAVLAFLVGCGSDEKSASAEQVIKLGLSADYPPFEFVDKDNKITGFDVELINEISKRVGFKVELANISFDGLIPALKAGKIDAIMSAMSATEDRKKSVDFTDSYYATENLFIRKKGSDISDKNLAGKNIGAQLGTVQEMAAGEIEGAKVSPYDSPLTAIMALKSGKIDYVIVDSSIGYGFLKQNDDIEEFLKLPDGSEGFSIAFDKDKKTDLIAKINDAIKAIKADGTFEKIAKKYDLQ
ncbi:ABC transporter substrate-binding protein [Campylobacter mucosalis]|uniref:basic amino acid ABC transporter substrate-binding protein n=1 Tax=Campylobacter mucosalis TaxID=202 RepID=UPI0004D67A20|nr:basic amino acid ABC transporter substrate-binding protein [Campylobacter mucosalis]KEA45664.1 ABC transporter substrate-binding protein [Campylobacter mucosalis]QKF62536.1 amino acid ABC transporter, periplasmic arginine/lysine/histidine-binding protein [Campylobacter mucosalis]